MLYEVITMPFSLLGHEDEGTDQQAAGDRDNKVNPRITSYNVCYTKLLRDLKCRRGGMTAWDVLHQILLEA